MKKLFLLIVAVAASYGISYAQRYQLYSYKGNVQITRSAGQSCTPALDLALEPTDLLTVDNGGYVSILDNSAKKVSSIGECKQLSVNKIISMSKTGFKGRLLSMVKGTSEDSRAFVSHKGDDPVPEFLYAMDHPGYISSYRIGLEVVDYETDLPVKSAVLGQRVYFRITNDEPVALCIGIIWKDSAGNTTDCLEDEGRYVIIPANSTVNLKSNVMEVAPPKGSDKIHLFASEEFFKLSAMSGTAKPSTSTSIKIGYATKALHIK